MATISPNNIVTAHTSRFSDIKFLPDLNANLVVVVHPSALLAHQDGTTQVAQIVDRKVAWVGTVGEEMLAATSQIYPEDARSLLASSILQGPNLWGVIPALSLFVSAAPNYLTSVYKEERPWLVIGQTDSAILAAPLNHLNENETPASYQAPVFANELPLMAQHVAKNSKLEMNHVWSLPLNAGMAGRLALVAHDRLARRLRRYYTL